MNTLSPDEHARVQIFSRRFAAQKTSAIFRRFRGAPLIPPRATADHHQRCCIG
jgi:hypothetical protein